MFYTLEYFPAPQPQTFTGTEEQLHQFTLRTGLFRTGGEPGKWILSGYAYGMIYEFEDENSNMVIRSAIPCKAMMRERYDKNHITKADYERLVYELNNGYLSFDVLYED